MTTSLKKDKGTFSATGSSEKVHGKKVGGFLNFGVGTVSLRAYDPSTGQPLIVETYTADKVFFAEMPQSVDWDVNCSAHTSDITFYIATS